MAPPSTMVEGEEGEKVRCSSSEQLVMSRRGVMVRFLIIRQHQQWLAGLLALTTNNLFHPNHPPANQHNNNQTRKLSNFQNFQMLKLAEFQLNFQHKNIQYSKLSNIQ